MNKRRRKGKAALLLVMKSRGWDATRIDSYIHMKNLLRIAKSSMQVVHPLSDLHHAMGTPLGSLYSYPFVIDYSVHLPAKSNFGCKLAIAKARSGSGQLECHYDFDDVNTFMSGVLNETKTDTDSKPESES